MSLLRLLVILLLTALGVNAQTGGSYGPNYAGFGGGSITSGSAINASSISATSIQDSALTSGSVVWASNGGLLTTDSSLLYTPTTLQMFGTISGTTITYGNARGTLSSSGITFVGANHLINTSAGTDFQLGGTLNATINNSGVSSTAFNGANLSANTLMGVGANGLMQTVTNTVIGAANAFIGLGGVATPSNTLHMAGRLIVQATSQNIDGIVIRPATSTVTSTVITRTSGNAGRIIVNNTAGTTAIIDLNGDATAASYFLRNMGIGVTTLASTPLEVSGTTSTTTLSVASSVTLTALPTGTAASNLCLTVTGGMVSTTSLSGCLGVSDPMVKADIRPLTYGLAEILAIDPVFYKDIREGYYPGDQVGVLAYSVDRAGRRYRGLDYVMPELVDHNASVWHGKKLDAVIYERLPLVLVMAVKQQQAEIAELRHKVGLEPHYTTLWARLKWLLTGD